MKKTKSRLVSKTVNRFDPVEIIWTDTVADLSGNWRDLENACCDIRNEQMIHATVGYILLEREDDPPSILVTDSYRPNATEDTQMLGTTMEIPTGCIREIRLLKRPGGKK